MKKEVYRGRAYSVEEILSMLRSQGLVIGDEKRAAHILQNVSYTRLKNYLVALMQDRKTHRFRGDATFENAYALYGFDRRLRELIFHEIEKIEVSIRTRIAYASNGSENGYWYVNPVYYKSDRAFDRIARQLSYELARSDNEGIVNFKRKYSNEFPPGWLAMEATSIGTLSNLYDSLKPGGLRRKIADYYGLDEDIFSSWLKHLVDIRNDCAHHSRVWNNAPTTKAAIPYSTRDPFPDLKDEDTDHIYMTLCIIKYLQNTVKPENTFSLRLQNLIFNFPMVDPRMMGFPVGWSSTPFWHQDPVPII